MLCQFHHGGSAGTLRSWRLVERPASSCVHCVGNVYCRGLSPTGNSSSSCCVNPISGCHVGGTEMMLSRAIGTWSLLANPSSSSTAAAAAARQSSRRCRNEVFPVDGNRRRVSRKNPPTSFTITDILANGTSEEMEEEEQEQDPNVRSSTARSIVRPWDDDDDDYYAVRCSARGSEGRGGGGRGGGNLWKSEASEACEGEGEADAAGRDGARSRSGRHVSQRKSDCPLDALQRMATRTQFDWMDTMTSSGYTSDGEGRLRFLEISLPIIDGFKSYLGNWVIKY